MNRIAPRAISRAACAAAKPRLGASAVPRRFNSSHAGEEAKKGSDVPWAIGSLVVFGSAFVYLTSPASKTHNEHGHVTGAKKPTNHGPGSSRNDDKAGDDAIWRQEGGDADVNQQTEIPEAHLANDAPEGNKHLAQHSMSKADSAPAQKSPSGRDSSNETSGIENSNFQSGLKHSKDGDHVSDPKRVVAASNAAKQEKKAAKESQQEGESDE
ncbi:unnamed protein product [Parajaminaea phylloscopi]